MTANNLCIISHLEKLVKKLSDDDFKHLTQEFGSENLNLLKQKDAYPYEYMDSFERFSEKKNYLTKNVFIGLNKMEQLMIKMN